VSEIVIYGLSTPPELVLVANIEADFVWDYETGALYTAGFEPLVLGQGKMVELAWN
jgi:hypothetical protein